MRKDSPALFPRSPSSSRSLHSPFRRARFPKKRLIIESTTYSMEQTKEEHGVQYDSNTIPLLERPPGHTYEGTPDMDVDVAVELKKEQLN